MALFGTKINDPTLRAYKALIDQAQVRLNDDEKKFRAATRNEDRSARPGAVGAPRDEPRRHLGYNQEATMKEFLNKIASQVQDDLRRYK